VKRILWNVEIELKFKQIIRIKHLLKHDIQCIYYIPPISSAYEDHYLILRLAVTGFALKILYKKGQ